MPVEIKPLFRPDVLRPRVKSFQLPDSAVSNRGLLRKWAELLAPAAGDKFKEQELLPDFLADVFTPVLGYARPTDNPDRYTISREQFVKVDGKFADAAIGEFGPNEKRFIIAVEGKGPTDPLDRPFKSRRMSAVDQGYRYAINLPCDWIIVTSMRQIRLYCKGNDQHTFERFFIADLADDDFAFKRFVFLLGADRVVPAHGGCHLDQLRAASEKAGRELTKEFYVGYANMREDAFEQICAKNSGHSRHTLLSATQKLLDRVLFCAFCEDRGLLPEDTLGSAFDHHDPYNPRPVWDNFRGLFRSIDTGNVALKIPQYNGGLFAEDDVLDQLTIPDAVCRHFKDVGEYDYRPVQEAVADTGETADGSLVDVDILGHIFEQSITDLEQLRNELDGLVPPQGKEKHKTRRKKEGAFYTPAFITRYIIEQTLGAVLADRFESLRQAHQSGASGTAVKALDDPRVYDLDALNKPQRETLTEFWQTWQDELATVRILDPACGSGAFLIEAFDQLHTAYEASNDRLEELRGHRTLYDLDRRILQNNLYGVDLNEEAIQICRLSLWIKTAQRGKMLTSLDHTIRVGNSVVDDPDVHPLAFDWDSAFPEVTEAGGFDVVVGNPPYIRQEWLKPYKSHWEKRFESYASTADIFTYFYELGMKRLRHNGRLGLITSGSWIKGKFGQKIRTFLAANAKIESIVDFGEYQPFEGAEMIRPTIMMLRRAQPGGKAKVFKWLTKGEPPHNLSESVSAADAMSCAHLNSAAWELESDSVRALQAKLENEGLSLNRYAPGKLLYGVKTGFNEAFLITSALRNALVASDPGCEPLIRKFLRGQDIREWHCDWREYWLICMKSSQDHNWSWSDDAESAETEFARQFPSLYLHFKQFEESLRRRSDQGGYWWELRTCNYWSAFDRSKILWPDICKQPRFNFDSSGYLIGDTSFMVSTEDPYLLGILGSWATWFFISKTAQPLRLRGDRWQYRLKKQWLQQLPIPSANESDHDSVSQLAMQCNSLGQARYDVVRRMQQRLITSFGESNDQVKQSSLNNKAMSWFELSLNQLGAALKSSFKLSGSPFRNPHTADEWEPYLAEKKAEVDRLTRQLQDAEAELNERVYRLFDLTPDEIALLQREVEH